VAFAQSVAADPASEADARRATTTLYHVTSAVMLAWEGARVHERRGDARRLLLSRLVLDHKLGRQDAFSQTPRDEAAIANLLLGGESVPLAQAAVHLG
jgi:acyl-CoA dehydrogenase